MAHTQRLEYSTEIWYKIINTLEDPATKVVNISVGAAVVVVDWVSATPVGVADGGGRRDESRSGCRSILAGAENPSLSRLCYRRLWGSRNRRALILGWAYYLDAFSSYPLRTWLPSVYRGHDNWYTRGASFPVLSY
ncbi:hypothetical protein R6Q59_010740 [Mikania micrantha]